MLRTKNLRITSKELCRSGYHLWLLIPCLLLSALKASADDMQDKVKAMAVYIFHEYLRYRETPDTDGQVRPFMVGIDGPSGAGKSSYVEHLNNYLTKLLQGYQLNRVPIPSLTSFGVDVFLHERAQRQQMFRNLGDGYSGNNDGREYRLEERNRCLDLIASGQAFETAPYDRATGLLGLQTRFQPADIVLVEGTHTLGSDIRGLFQLGICLDCKRRLLEWNLHSRNCRRGLEKALAIVKVVFSQLDEWIWGSREAASLELRYAANADLPELTADNFHSPPRNRERRLMHVRFDGLMAQIRFYLGNGWRAGSPESLLQSLILLVEPNAGSRSSSGALSMSLGASNRLNGQRLIHTPQNNNCLFTSLRAILDNVDITREQVIEQLGVLQIGLENGSLYTSQSRLLNPFRPLLTQEADSLRAGEPGTLTSIVAVWAYLLGTARIPEKPLVLLIQLGDSFEVWSLGTDGIFTELSEVPEGDHLMIYNGADHWEHALSRGQFDLPRLPTNSASSGYGSMGNSPSFSPLSP